MPTKRCPCCLKEKDAKDFILSYTKKGKPSSYCEDCSPNLLKHYAEAVVSRTEVRATQYKLQRKTGQLQESFIAGKGEYLTQYNTLHRSQNGKCAICGQSGLRLVIDHDHASGKIRGLLCNSCNIGLGQFNDDPTMLRKAADYVSDPRPPLDRIYYASTSRRLSDDYTA